MFLSWHDKGLVFNQNQRGANNISPKKEEISIPNIKFLNIENSRQTAYSNLEVKPDRTVYYSEKFIGIFNSNMHLKKFPFDSQKLKLIMRCLNDTKNIVLFTDETKIGKSPDAFLPGWKIGNITVAANSINYKVEDQHLTVITYEISLSRFSSFYIWNTTLPSLFISSV